MLHRRRLNSVQLLLVCVLLFSSVYLWTKRIHPFQYEDNSIGYKSEGKAEEPTKDIQMIPLGIPASFEADGSIEEPRDSNQPSVVDPVADNENDAAVREENKRERPESSCLPATTEGIPNEANGIEPLPKFNFDESNMIDDNRTLQLLDLWSDDGNCTQHQVHLLPDNAVPEPVGLVSFPGSGNSWLRMLLMGATGIFIRSVYGGDDSQFQSQANSTFQLPADCGCTLLQKTHDFTLDAALFYLHVSNRTRTLEEFKNKGILIIRNPFTAIRSYRNFEYGGMQGKAPEEAFVGLKWDNFVSRSVASWETLATVWINGLKQGGIIYYERLQNEMETELRRLIGMLGLTLNEDRLSCVLQHARDNSFKRTIKTSEDPYTASQRLLIHKAIDHVQQVLKQRGLDPLPTEYYKFYDVIPEYGIFT